MTVSDKGGKCNNGVHYSSLSSLQFQFNTFWLHPFCLLKEATSGCCFSMAAETQHAWRAPMLQQRVLWEWHGVCHQMWKCVDNEGEGKNNLNFVGCTHDKCIFLYNCIYSFTKIWRYHYHAASHNKNNTQHSTERDRKSTFNATGTLILINNEKLKDPRQLAYVLNFL